ncbi:alpha/beta hydrolase [Bradyrhizobium japonicum]
MIERLQRDGYPVVGFGNPLLGPAIDTAYLRSLLDKIQGPVILAAHSYGGAVITQAGDDPKVKGLVYAASIMPAVGEAATHLLERYPAAHSPRPSSRPRTHCPTVPAARISSTSSTSSTATLPPTCPRAWPP